MPAAAPADARRGALKRGLLLFALVNSLILPLALAWAPDPASDRGMLRETYGRLARLQQEGDSWGPMLQAYEYLGRDEPKPLYAKIFFTRHVKFQYPPTALLPFPLLAEVVPREAWLGALNAVSLLWLAVSIAVCGALLAQSLARLGEPGGRGVTLLGIWLALAFYPLVKAYSLGQVQTWVNGLFALALACWLAGRPRSAGVLVGLMCLIKPHYALFALWAALRRRWDFALPLAIVVALGLCASLALFGIGNHRDYADVVSFMSRRGEAYFPNQSWNGLLNRLLHNGNNLQWMGASFAPYHPWVFWSTTLTSGALVMAALVPVRRAHRGDAVGFVLLALSVTAASPIAWEHHYGILPPIYAAALGCLGARPALGRATLACLALSYALTSNYFGIANCLAETNWNVLQSSLYLGALLLLFALHAIRLRAYAAAPS